jgi:hypothetical protein
MLTLRLLDTIDLACDPSRPDGPSLLATMEAWWA